VTIVKQGCIDGVEFFRSKVIFPKIIDLEVIKSIRKIETYKLLRDDYEYDDEKSGICAYLEYAVEHGNHPDFSVPIEEFIPPPVFEAIFESIVISMMRLGNVDWLPSDELKYDDFEVSFKNVDRKIYMPRTGSAYPYDFKLACEEL
jgi:hypothetical protein